MNQHLYEPFPELRERRSSHLRPKKTLNLLAIQASQPS